MKKLLVMLLVVVLCVGTAAFAEEGEIQKGMGSSSVKKPQFMEKQEKVDSDVPLPELSGYTELEITVPDAYEWYLNISRDLSEKLGTMVKSDAYLSFYRMERSEWIERMQEADYTTVQSAYCLTTVEMGGMKNILKIAIGDTLPDDLLDEMLDKVLTTIPMQYNGTWGVEVVADSSIAQYSRTYIMPEDFAPMLLLLEVDGAVTYTGFMKTGDETITANVGLLYCDEDQTITKIVSQLSMLMFPLYAEQIF